MRVAVITPYYKEETEHLRKAHDSVAAQSHPATHFMVADGFPNEEVARWKIQHIVLSHNLDDFGDTPRVIGALAALAQGFEAIAFLDADNWYYPYHVQAMVTAHQETGRNVCLASRSIHRPDGSFMYNYKEVDSFADINSLFLIGPAARLVPFLSIKPKAFAELDDRIFWKCLVERKIPFVRVTTPTVAYRTSWKSSYEDIGETPPPDARDNIGSNAFAWLETASEEEKADWSTFLFGAPNRW